jgi:asparagine synthase (glutamine-hydrolysing)
MSENSLLLTRGSPIFSDPQAAAQAGAGDVHGAWQTASRESGLIAAARATTGEFAVALRGDQGQVTMAVDRLALGQLCYRVDGENIRVATRADALADANQALDPQAIYDYLYFHCIPSPRTVFKGVHRLPAAHAATFDRGTLAVAPYWRPRFTEPGAAPQYKQLRDEFLQLLSDAVAGQLDGSTPACFLSGGTDSSTVAGMISRVAKQPAWSYSIGFEAEGYDEMAYARLAARHFGTLHHEYYVTPADLVRSIPEVAASFDQPFGNSSALPAYYCSLAARKDGISRILAGDGGDELFGGNTRYLKQRVFALYDRMPPALRRALLDPLGDMAALKRVPLLRKASNYIAQARLPLPARLETYNLLERLGADRLLTPAFLQQVDPSGPARDQSAVWGQAETDSPLNRHLAFDWRYTLAENDLVKVRGTCELAGLSVGFPLLDQRLLDFSARLPTSYKVKGVTLRWFFKEALKGFLPDEIIAKKKHGFGLPFGVWTTTHPALFELASDSLHGLAARGLVRSDFVTSLLKTHLPEHPGYYGEMIWILMMLEQWLMAKAPGYRIG